MSSTNGNESPVLKAIGTVSEKVNCAKQSARGVMDKYRAEADDVNGKINGIRTKWQSMKQQRSKEIIGGTTLAVAAASFTLGRMPMIRNAILAGAITSFIVSPDETIQVAKAVKSWLGSRM